jgi:[ribosomal protein S18]-alanine N-acetyltransferase
MELKNAALMTIRPAASMDCDRILNIEIAASPFPWSHDAIDNELSNPNGFNFVALADDGQTACGFLLTVIVADELCIHNLGTHPDVQRRGVSRRLLETTLDRARIRGAAHAYLEVRSKNVPAITLYEKLGFSVQSVRKKYYGDNDDALIMRKKL